MIHDDTENTARQEGPELATDCLPIPDMAEEKKTLNGEIVAARSRRGARIFRTVRRKGESVGIDPRFLMRVHRGGKRVYFQLPSTLSEAIKEADKIDAFLDVRSNSLDDAIKLFDPDRWALKNPAPRVCTVGELLAAHEAAEKALGLGEKTAKGYRQSLLILFSDALAERRTKRPGDDEIKAMGLDELTPRLVADFKVARVGLAGDDKADQERKKRSANGVLRSVASLFSQQARTHYTNLTLPPELDSTLANMAFRKVSKIRKRLPSADVIRRLFAEVGELRAKDENAYLGFMLAAHAGLRLGEIVGARLDWLVDGTPPRLWVTLGEDFKAKGGDDRYVEIQPWFEAELRSLCAGRKNLLTGTNHEKKEEMPWRLNPWVKARGFAEASGEKGIHGLRFLFGAYITNRKNLYTAMKFLGHASQKTTETHYADLMLDETLFACWETAPSWVKVPEPAC